MYNPSIHNKIELLGHVISDIKEVEEEIQLASDPALLHELTVEKNELIAELDMVGSRCMTLIEAYIEDCKTEGVPVYLDYYRVLKELKKAEIR